MSIIHVVSMSGGKDSTATAILAIEQHGRENCRFVMADTGNEHEQTMEYALDYLPGALGVRIDVVKADFTDEFAPKRANLERIAAGDPESAVYGKRKFMYHWTPEAARRALDLLHPTGNPYLDLCLVRGGFPSRKRQFCTEYLKRNPLTEYSMALIEQGHAVWSWQGVRIDESDSRAKLGCIAGIPSCDRLFEVVGGGMFIHRPILRWTAEDCFEAHRLYGIKPNPLYSQAMSRVGCMPCINCSKGELRAIADRFPAHIERIAEWERLVQGVTRPKSPATFFHSSTANSQIGASVVQVVDWSRTTRGGRQRDLLANLEDHQSCSSAYGLCE